MQQNCQLIGSNIEKSILTLAVMPTVSIMQKVRTTRMAMYATNT
jgi:hypothetical protein